jgi:hypothetical protein
MMASRPPGSLGSVCVINCLAAVALAACATSDPIGGQNGTEGTSTAGTGGSSTAGSGGPGQGGSAGTAGATGSGGSAGTTGAGGRGGATGSGGAGGRIGTGGTTATGGTSGTAGTTGTGGSTVDCSGTLPTGGTQHTSANAQGTVGSLAWSIWSNGTAGSITTFTVPAFSAAWNNSGDFLAREGIEWGNAGKTFDQFGTIAAQFAETKSGTGGGFSYIGIYGWSNNPCIEYYIVEDSYNRMPVNPGNTTNKGTVMIDGGTYTLYTRPTSGTGGSRCGSSVSSWTQFYSVRQTARQCGQISITDHFKAWAAAGMTLGTLLEAKLLIETGGGTGSIDFTTASVTAQ